MSSLVLKPDYKKTNELFSELKLEESVSNVHGTLCGLLSSGKMEALTVWFEELLSGLDEGDRAVHDLRQLLGGLFKLSKESVDRNLGLTPFIPDDNQPLLQRAVALAEWCHGFLYGVGISGVKESDFSEQTREALHYFSQLVLLDSSNVEEGEEGEVALNDLFEFVRVATMQVCDDLMPVPDEEA